MKEIPRTWPTSIAFGWAFLWRALAIYVPAAVIIQELAAETLGSSLTAFLQLVTTLLSFFAAGHWLRQRGFGSIKLMLVEWAEYQSEKDGG